MARTPQLYMSAIFLIATASMPLATTEALSQQLDAPADRSVGLDLFLSTGCGACHRIAGTEAQGRIGPDLTHLASRATLGANLMPMTATNLADWIARTQELKPGARMPSFGMLPGPEINAIVDYLASLK